MKYKVRIEDSEEYGPLVYIYRSDKYYFISATAKLDRLIILLDIRNEI